jgi:sialidase-1
MLSFKCILPRLIAIVVAWPVLISAKDIDAAALRQTDVFISGQGGYHTYRIPAMVQASDGTLLAFAEGRKNSASDLGDIDLVLKRSFDGGETWGPLQIISSNGTSQAHNPAPVVDTRTGNIILPFVLGQRDPVVSISTNGGQNWSAPVSLKGSAKLETWNGYFFGPMHGIQLERGPHAGRLIIPGNHSLLDVPLNPAGRESHLIYSDNGGVTWHIGGVLANASASVNPGESSVVELMDGRLYQNSRNQGSSIKRRVYGYSLDGGETIAGVAQLEPQLVDSAIQASTLRYAATDKGDSHSRILFANAKHESERVRMTIRSSFDETLSWTAGKLVHRGYSGYNDMVKLGEGAGAILYERGESGNYERITFARFDTAWLDDPALMQLDFRDLTFSDQRGNGVNPQIEGGPSVVSMVPGSPFDNFARFDGRNDALRVADTHRHLFDFEAQDSFTLEAVFRTSAHGASDVNASGPLIAKDVGPDQPSYWLRVQNGKVRMFLDDGLTATSLTSEVNVNDGQWHHVAATIDREADELRLYLDQQLIGSSESLPVGGFANSNDLLIGAFNDSPNGSKRFRGDIGLIRISEGTLSPDSFFVARTPGDFDGDGEVDGNDLARWQANYPVTFGATFLKGDADGDGDVDGRDFLIWQKQNTAAVGGSQQVAVIPEFHSFWWCISMIIIYYRRV